MDIDESIQALLKNNGWSCDDLLAKLQKFKSTKNEQETAKTSANTLNSNTCRNEISPQLEASPKGADDTSDSGNIETFSDTDEEETEVNVTNSHIINEIIEDIYETENPNIQNKINAGLMNVNESSEVTEVRVVEVNADDEDDNFEETDSPVCSETYPRRSLDENISLSEQQHIGENSVAEVPCVERIARKRPNTMKEMDEDKLGNISQDTSLIDISSDESSQSEGSKNEIEYVETFPRKKIKLNVDESIIETSNTENNSMGFHNKDNECNSIRTVQYESDENKCTATISKSSGNSNQGIFSGANSSCEINCESDESLENIVSQDKTTTESPQKNYFSTFLNFIGTNSTEKTSSSNQTSFEKYHPQQSGKKNFIKLGDNKTTKKCEEVRKIKVFQRSPCKYIPNVLKFTKKVTSKSAANDKIIFIKKVPSQPVFVKQESKVSFSKVSHEIIPRTGINENNTIYSRNEKFDSNTVDEHVDEAEKGRTKDTVPDENSSHAIISSIESIDQFKDTGDDSPSDDLSDNSPIENLEDIRNNLKLQLSCLRTRKKQHALHPLTTKVLEHIECSAKLSNALFSEVDTTANCDTRKDIGKVMKGNGDQDTLEGDSLCNTKLYTQTNELGLVISDVQGGVDVGNNDDNIKTSKINDGYQSDKQISDSIADDEKDAVQGGLLDQIRRIIHKQRSPRKPKDSSSSNNIRDCRSLQSITSQSLYTSQGKLSEEISCNENSQSSFTNENVEGMKKKSPFVSDSLDEFLVGDSKLNISYKVPQSGAEAGLKEKFIDESPLMLKKTVEINEAKEKPSSSSSMKAKTLAQKRKLLERQRRVALRKLKKNKCQKSEQVDVKTKKMEDKIITNKSYIICGDKKLWVKTMCPSKCIAKIGQKKVLPSGPLTPRARRLKKFSLLDECRRRLDFKPSYRPGPLCKKTNLQVTGINEWESQTKNLPKIILELIPTLGKRFPNNICSRISSLDGNLDSNRIEFALSMLKTQSTEGESGISRYSFPLNYSNKQEKVLVRKKQERKPPIYPCESEDICNVDEKSSEDAISDILKDLIRYVEIKELSPSLIKEDNSAMKQEDVSVNQLSPINNNISVFKKPHKKRSRFEYELLRLSCKVVNVEVEQSPAEDNCGMPYCQLGCVCKSLKCDGAFSNHCQLVKCMFECACPLKERTHIYDHTLTLPAGTDVLSNDAVSRIEDEAKKNMAKVEREFTQTVIQTSDKTIVVGLGGRNKTRRNAKAPVKYLDFVEKVETPKLKAVESDSTEKCVVSLEKLDLSEIIPYCLSHSLYGCHCAGRSNYIPLVPKLLASNYSEWKRYLRIKSPRSYSFDLPEKENVNSDDKIPYISKGSASRRKKMSSQEKVKATVTSQEVIETIQKNETVISEDSRSETGSLTSLADEIVGTHSPYKRTARNTKKKLYDENFIDTNDLDFIPSDCSRVKEIDPKYLRKKVYNERIFQHDFINNLTDSDMFRAKINASRKNHQLLEADLLKQQLLGSHLAGKMREKTYSIDNTQSQISKSKRKQTLNVRQEMSSPSKTTSSDPMMSRSRTNFEVPAAVEAHKPITVKPVFDGEIIIDRSNQELLAKMGPKTLQDGYARLLPWKALTESFRTGKINIWSMVDQPSRLLVNLGDKKAPKNYVDIKESQQTTEVIMWIIKNKLPSSYEENSVSFILKETKDNFEICGVCTKNFAAEPEEHDGQESQGEDKLGVSDDDKRFTHKDLNGDIQVLYMYSENYRLQELVEESTLNDIETSIDKNKLYMWAAVPEIYRVCKWRVIYLNSDFSYLYFTNIKYSIRYTDLLSIGKIAKARNRTFRLKNDALQASYDHGAFGIYFDPHYSDRVFIGPYFKPFRGFDVETLRYINKYLVSTESFNKMRGTNDYKCGHWLLERPYSNSKMKRQSEREELLERAAHTEEALSTQLNSLSSSEIVNSEEAETIERPPSSKSSSTNSKDRGVTIDLTIENDDTADEREKRIQPRRVVRRKLIKSNEKATPCMIIMHNTDEIQIIDAPPRKPEEFNRYIFTNIPDFGYLGAYRYPSGKIDVSWPFENKLLRFPNSAIAIDFLQERFSALLQPVPETFNIQLIISTEIDVHKNKPIDSNALNGHFVCGDFGFHNISTMSNKECLESLGLPRPEILKMFARRAQVFVKKRVEHLATLLKIEKNNNGSFQIENILNAATEEIEKLIEQDKKNVATKNELLVRKRDKAIKVFGLISELPSDKRNVESLKFRWILNRTEPIEIQDSDDDSKEASSKDLTQDHEVGDESPDIKVLQPQECFQSVMTAKGNIELIESSQKTDLDDSSTPVPSVSNNSKSLLKPLIRVSTSLYPASSPKTISLSPKPISLTPKPTLIAKGSKLKMISPKALSKLVSTTLSNQGVKIVPKAVPKLVSTTFTNQVIKVAPKLVPKLVSKTFTSEVVKVAPKAVPKLVPKNFSNQGVKLSGIMKTIKSLKRVDSSEELDVRNLTSNVAMDCEVIEDSLDSNNLDTSHGYMLNLEETDDRGPGHNETAQLVQPDAISDIRIDNVYTIKDSDFTIELDEDLRDKFKGFDR